MAILLVLLTIFLFNITYVSAGSDNSSVTIGWVSDPDGRGTFTILSSCVLTLSLCVYTAIHLNVRPYHQKELQAWIETTKWVIMGVLGPELLVFVAWRQYLSAIALDRIIKDVKEADPKHGSHKSAQPDRWRDEDYSVSNSWTRVHSFYASMGGFVVDLDEVCQKDNTSFTNLPRVTLTPRGIALLARYGYLPKISREDILDKNKSDNASRLLSVLQALWMFAQIIGRVASKLPVTLLEVNTLAHIICAIIFYLLWWNKPKLINEPTKLSGTWVPSLCAYMYMSSQISGWKSLKPGILKKDWIDPEFAILAVDKLTSLSSESPFIQTSPKTPNEATVVPVLFSPSTTLRPAGSRSPEMPSSSIDGILPSDLSRSLTSAQVQVCPATLASSTAKSPQVVPYPVGFSNSSVSSTSSLTSLASAFKVRPMTALAPKGMSLSEVGLAINARLEASQCLQSSRWALAAEALHNHPALQSRIKARETIVNDTQMQWLQPVTEELLDESIGNWASSNLLRSMSGFVMGMVLWSASMVCGGVHAAAWHGHFPSRTEAILWRFSSVCIPSSGFTWIMINLLARISNHFKAYWKNVETLRAHWTSLVPLGTLAALCGLAYVLARVYLVVEAFISLRKLPAAAYDSLQWTELIQHL